MIISDCHMHTSFSSDSEAPMESMILSAIDKGLNTICITEHMDYDYPVQEDGCDFLLDVDAYKKKLFELKDKYKDQLEVLFGIECGMMPYLAPRYEALIAAHDFDFVICSSHLVNGADPYYPNYFEDKTEYQAYGEYFASIAENINAFSNFDTYAHIDYVVRYGPNQNRDYTYAKYQEHLEPVLKAIISSGKALEVNTGSFIKGMTQPHPQMDVLAAYRDMGGELITIGADAHKPLDIACGYPVVSDMLKSLGFKHYTIFKNRQPHMIQL